MPKSTSIFNINADKGLNKWQMKLYMLANTLNNSFPNLFIDKNLIIKNFKVENIEKYWPLIHPQSSPSRALSDLFWITLPWDKIKQELKNINILDIGCGSGGYLEKFINWSHNQIDSYTGFDINEHPNWNNLSNKYKLANFKALNSKDTINNIPPQTNFIISQSAIEHFEEDLKFFKQINKFINNKKEPVIQVHLFPSAACLKLYKYHGVRQYIPRTISKITKLFKNSSKILYYLGSKNCNKIHYQYITKPYYNKTEDLRRTRTNEYNKYSIEAIKKDTLIKNTDPGFYALVIKSYTK